MDISKNDGRWIPLNSCRDGHLYYISGRNSNCGIFRKNEKGFSVARYKFGDWFLDTEDHWDTGAPHGTAMPYIDICESPNFKTEEEELDWLREEAKKIDVRLYRQIHDQKN